MHTITSPFGFVVRIVVFSKNNTPQALVEFENSSAAAQAKSALDGKDVYPGSCTLQISFARATKLNVNVNSDTQRDYTNPNLPTKIAFPMSYPTSNEFHTLYPTVSPPTKAVLLVHGLDPKKMTPDRVFNLFCIYGNVAKVKHLPEDKGTLVQMCDNKGADQSLTKLHKLSMFGNQLSIYYSRLKFIADTPRDEGNSPTSDFHKTTDFTCSALNRFSRNPNSKPSVLNGPTDTLYFVNAPEDFDETAMIRLFVKLGVDYLPTNIKFCLPKPKNTSTPVKTEGRDWESKNNTKNGSTKAGFMKFESVSAAAEALVCVNNEKVDGYPLKLSFTVHQFPYSA